MINWFQNSDCRHNQRALIQEAKEDWKEAHPGEALNAMKAAKEFAVSVGQPEDWLLLSSRTAKTYADVIATIDQALVCPECEARMFIQELPDCLRANPKMYTFVFSCQECLYHWFTRWPRDRMLDLMNLVKSTEPDAFPESIMIMGQI